MRAMPNTTSLVDYHGASGTGPEGIQPHHLFDSCSSDLDICHIAQIGDLVEVSCEAWVGGQSAYVSQKFTIRHYVPSTG